MIQFLCLVNLSVVLARNNIDTTRDIQKKSGFLASARESMKSIPAPFKFKKVPCGKHFPEKGADDPCYSLDASDDTLLPALVMYAGTYDEANKMIDDQTDRIRIIAETNPRCSFIKTDIKIIAPAMVGPSSIEITKYHSTKATKNLLLGAGVSISTPKFLPIGQFTLDVSYEYSRDLINENSVTNGLKFSAPAGQTCVPSVISTFFVCDEFTGDFSVSKLETVAPTKRKTVPAMLIPLFEDGTVKASHYGCIDYS
ncbi:hypothetical protein DSO57_1016112 [Entomophthora muscae]|uniref:Uncharacterized protein n=1 Tax=Entomophthora muscae TaxID=34485 RepID=A0ACC2TSK8_9FUNG|nr:hypothetical protein DSO57_1016112 [Entomophthora muscae]